MDIFDGHFLVARLHFPIQRPGHSGIGPDCNAAGGGEGQHFAVIFRRLHRPDALGQLPQLSGGPEQQHLEFPVPQIHLLGVQGQNAPHAGRVADGAKEKIVLDHFVVQLQFDMLGPQLGQLGNAAQNIGRMAQGIFHVLGGGIAGPGEGPEGGHIGKIPITEFAHVQIGGFPGDDGLRRLQNVGGQAQAGGEIIGGPGGDIAHGDVDFAVQEAVDGLVEGTVAAAAGHQVHFRGILPDDVRGLAPGAGHIAFHPVTGPVEDR